MTEAVVMLGEIDEASQTLISHMQRLKAFDAFSRVQQAAELQTLTQKIDAVALVFLALHAELHGGSGALHTWLRRPEVSDTAPVGAGWPCCCAGYVAPPSR